jgi:hypothetical protein
MNPQTELQRRYPTAPLVVYNAFMDLCRQFEPEPRAGETHEHHICPKKQFPEYRYDPDNLITLYLPLHAHAHRLLGVAVRELRSKANPNWIAAISSPEARRKMSETKRGRARVVSEKTHGYKLSEETRHKMSESRRGHIVSSKTRRKLSEFRRGRKLSEEHIRKATQARNETFRIKREARVLAAALAALHNLNVGS